MAQTPPRAMRASLSSHTERRSISAMRTAVRTRRRGSKPAEREWTRSCSGNVGPTDIGRAYRQQHPRERRVLLELWCGRDLLAAGASQQQHAGDECDGGAGGGGVNLGNGGCHGNAGGTGDEQSGSDNCVELVHV